MSAPCLRLSKRAALLFSDLLSPPARFTLSHMLHISIKLYKLLKLSSIKDEWKRVYKSNSKLELETKRLVCTDFLNCAPILGMKWILRYISRSFPFYECAAIRSVTKIISVIKSRGKAVFLVFFSLRSK